MTPNPLDWLLEPDAQNPGARYFALRDLLGLPESDPQVRAARAAVMTGGPVPLILAAQSPEGWWAKPGSGYSPKYQGTVWSLLFLAELGADPADERVRAGCEYLLSHSPAGNGAFAASQKPVPSAAIHCLNGNLLYALRRLGFAGDPRARAAQDWLARSIVGEEPITYYASAVSGPGFACAVNEKRPCAWGANKAVRALLQIPPEERDPLIQRALQAGADLLLSRDPAAADYPFTGKVSSAWFKLGFPLSYWSDALETLANLIDLGYANDPRLHAGLEWLEHKRGADGRWKLENNLNKKMWVDIETQGKPSKWVTLRALKVLKRAGR